MVSQGKQRRRQLLKDLLEAPERWGEAGRPRLTTGEVAMLLGVSRQSVLRWARSGALPGVHTLGGHLRFDAGDIQTLLRRWEAERGRPPAAPAAQPPSPLVIAPRGKLELRRGKPMRIYAVVQGRYGKRMVQNIRQHGPPSWQVEVYEAPPRLPLIIDDLEGFLPNEPPAADLLLSLGEDPGVAQLIPDLVKLTGAKAVIAPIDRSEWLPQGLKTQLKRDLEAMGVAAIFPKPFCTLTETSCGFRRAAEAYDNELIAQFAQRFGAPRLKIAADEETKTIAQVTVERGTPCGCTLFVAERLEGVSVEEAEYKAGLLHHHYPCLASMQQEQIDDVLRDTLMHVSGYILKEAVEAEVRPYKRPPVYYTPSERLR